MSTHPLGTSLGLSSVGKPSSQPGAHPRVRLDAEPHSKAVFRDFPGGPVASASTEGDPGSNPGQGTKVRQATQGSQKKEADFTE